MVDRFAGSRLPDLPNAGYSSPKQKATSDLVMFWLRDIERDRETLLAIVIDGLAKWRKVAGQAWCLDSGGRVSALSTELLDQVFRYMVMLAGPNPAQQLLILKADPHRHPQSQSTRAHLDAAVAALRRVGPRLRKKPR